MTRRVLCALLKLSLRVFFRRIEVAGLERVPRTGAVIFVLNHPNGLLDPIFILCLAPRPVSFLAKSALFRMPLIGSLARALDSIPVYRRQDAGEDVSRNRETFERSRALLARGGTIGICPEGVSHNEPRLLPLKTGAARIALGAASCGPGLDVKVVPAGLYYTAKTTFRSAALLYFGEPLTVEPVALDEDRDPPREAVQALSNRIESALREVVLNAEHDESLATIERAERIFSSADERATGGRHLARELRLRRRFIEGYAFHRSRSLERLAGLEARIRRYEESLKHAGLDVEDLSASRLSGGQVARYALKRVLPFLVLSPFAITGALLHYPAYRLAGFLATRFSRSEDDLVSTIKIFAAMLLFPLTWVAIAALCYAVLGWKWAVAALLAAPAAGYAAVLFFEELDRVVGGTKSLAFLIRRRWFFLQLLAERRAIHDEIVALGDEASRSTG
ncbi:MAG TPA: lysophospholipid acyltransferase family protein [Blastocatellia bacterium]|nr:lysophospholipid acyltransferase family protein [Blastocatellia bacterium]